MGKDTGIQWTRFTWNPWHGCIQISPGCDFCYMYRDKEHYGQDPRKITRGKTTFNDPLTKFKEPGLVFTCSWSDFFIRQADDWRAEAYGIMLATPHLMYQVLTKRIERAILHLPPKFIPNMILGISAENQDAFDHRYAILAEIKRKYGYPIFLSLEPLLDKIKVRQMFKQFGPPDWVIVGGESGNDNGRWGYRACDVLWIPYIISDCADFEVPVFVKQLGTHIAKRLHLKHRAGGDWLEWPPPLMVRQFPKIFDPFLDRQSKIK